MFPKRSQFASWSPLGWIGPVSWYRERHPGDMMRKSTFEHLVTVKAAGIDVVTEHDCRALNLHTQQASHQIGSATGLLNFKIHGWTGRSEQQYGIAIQAYDATEAILVPFWDGVPTPSATVQLKGLLLTGVDDRYRYWDRLCSEDSQASVLVLKLCGDHYERVGVFELPANADDRATVTFRARKTSPMPSYGPE
ncbi:hypothetical protein BU23DRAFT_567446 [Bimuria novae-zelandiae CBS 107.79]|uniref:Uncharacterized protein n=1 Tax=Bimuria novae-zelandiae CBS 107.79 TaxID=1447943 RepID=A0A6A5VD66_9PLEO|nr:hypothetical protein BU23DRAFT_567446 [Bimuria novae-zelandiae CBS 107.79]